MLWLWHRRYQNKFAECKPIVDRITCGTGKPVERLVRTAVEKLVRTVAAGQVDTIERYSVVVVLRLQMISAC